MTARSSSAGAGLSVGGGAFLFFAVGCGLVVVSLMGAFSFCPSRGVVLFDNSIDAYGGAAA